MQERRFALWIASAALALHAGNASPQATCKAIEMRSPDLRQLLGTVLGDLKPLAQSYDARLDSSKPDCYVNISIKAAGLLPFVPTCELRACSVPVVSGRRIALKEFRVGGCDALFSALGVSRKVPTSFADASAQISSHCGSEAFEFKSVSLQERGGEPAAVLELKPSQP
jgi:hypothetical protein